MRERLRIAMVAACPFPLARGTPVRIYRLAEALVGRGHHVEVVTYHLGDSGNAAPFRIRRIRGIPFYRRLAAGPAYRKLLLLDPLLSWMLARRLRVEEAAGRGFDVVHAHHYEGLLVALAAGRRGRVSPPPVVYDAHTLLESELPSYRLGLPRWFKGRLGRFLDRCLPARSSHVVAVSEEIRRRLLTLGAVGGSAITVAPSGVEAGFFEVPLDARWRGEPGTRTIVFAGGLGPYQGIDLLLVAFGIVRERRRDVRLLLVTADAFHRYEPLARRLGIREAISLVPGDLDRLPAYLAGADVAVNPRPHADGLLQKTLNYMAAGKAIVSSDGSAGPLRDGETAVLARAGDTGELAAAILAVLADEGLARRLGGAAREEVRRRFSWEATAGTVEAVYRGLVER